MSKFKVGDKIRCIDNSNCLGYLTEGNVYVVVEESSYSDFVCINPNRSLCTGNYFVDRFELVQESDVLTPEEVFEHIRKGTKLQVRHTGKVGHKDWCDVVKPELTTYEVMVDAEWRIKPEPEIIELNGKKYREIVE